MDENNSFPPKAATPLLALVEQAAIEFLQSRGYVVLVEDVLTPWTTVGALAKELKIGRSTLSHRLKNKFCPAFVKDAANGRINRLKLNPRLRDWLSRPLQKAK